MLLIGILHFHIVVQNPESVSLVLVYVARQWNCLPNLSTCVGASSLVFTYAEIL
jgi:hypothetical protein